MKITNILIGVLIGVTLSFGAFAIKSNLQQAPVTTLQLLMQARAEVEAITVDDYKQMRDDGVEHVLLDVREQAEWDAGHIEDDTFIPRGLLEFKVADTIADQSSHIVILCKTGGRAALAGQTLQEMGYTNVSYIKGGYEEYSQL